MQPDILGAPVRLPSGSFSLANGQMFNLITPNPDHISIDVVAAGLAKVCRYSGQLAGDDFYSVAEHSTLLSRLVEPAHALAALLHDASEGLGLGDVVGPLKALLPEYVAIERRMMNAVADAFGLERGFHERRAVVLADQRLLATEQAHLRKLPAFARHEPFPRVEFRRALPAEARRMFLARYEELKT